MKKLLISLFTALFVVVSSQLIAMDEIVVPETRTQTLNVTVPQPVKTNFTQSGTTTIRLTSTDGVEFQVSAILVKLSTFLKAQVEICGDECTIPLPTIESQDLERTLIFLEGGTIAPDLTREELMALLATHDCLDLQNSKDPLYQALLPLLSWQNDSLELLFCNDLVSHWDKLGIIRLLANNLKWNTDCIARFHENKTIPKCYIIALIEELLEANLIQLIQMVNDWQVHSKRLRDRGLDPLECCYFEQIPSEKDREEHQRFREILGEDYDAIALKLQQKYQ